MDKTQKRKLLFKQLQDATFVVRETPKMWKKMLWLDETKIKWKKKHYLWGKTNTAQISEHTILTV